MTSGSAELPGFHVLNRAIGNLRSDEHVQGGGDADEPGEPLQRNLAVKCRFRQALANLAPGKIHADRHQQQANEEYRRKNQENHDANIGIIGVPADLQWQYKQPGNDSRRNESGSGEAQPMAGEDEPRWPFDGRIHAVRARPHEC